MMYLHIGNGETVRIRDLVAFFDFDSMTVSDVSFSTLGEIFDCDHTTIMAAFRKVEAAIATDPEFSSLVLGMMEEIRN